MSKEESGQQQMQAEQPKESDLTKSGASRRGYSPSSGGDANLGYLSESGDAKFQRRPRRDIADL